MIIKHKELITEEKEVLDNIICNCCGKSIDKTKNKIGNNMHINYISLHNCTICKKESNDYFEDFDLCEDCFDKIIGKFKIPVKIVCE